MGAWGASAERRTRTISTTGCWAPWGSGRHIHFLLTSADGMGNFTYHANIQMGKLRHKEVAVYISGPPTGREDGPQAQVPREKLVMLEHLPVDH